MKKHIILLSILFIAISCQKNEVADLKRNIQLLNKENSDLKDSIQNINKSFLRNNYVHAIPEQMVYKVNEKANVRFAFLRAGSQPKYNLYKVNKESKKREYLVKNSNKDIYLHEFSPESINDTVMEVWAETIINKDTIRQPGMFIYNVTN